MDVQQWHIATRVRRDSGVLRPTDDREGRLRARTGSLNGHPSMEQPQVTSFDVVFMGLLVPPGREKAFTTSMLLSPLTKKSFTYIVYRTRSLSGYTRLTDF
ncbi:hypothetical protein J6590_033844 [Homalodisca vitripennis]|nr:hypothetical protein J6590_033844 [Homalodisca vitripennis]